MAKAPKYRLLTKDELENLETEFIQFLASNSIPAEDWQKLKSEAPDRVQDLICIFSDIVLEQVLRKVTLLEKRTSHELQIYKIEANCIRMHGLLIDPAANVDLQRLEGSIDLTAMTGPGMKSSIVSGEKQIKDRVPEAVFALIEQGAQISRNEQLFETFENLLRDRQS